MRAARSPPPAHPAAGRRWSPAFGCRVPSFVCLGDTGTSIRILKNGGGWGSDDVASVWCSKKGELPSKPNGWIFGLKKSGSGGPRGAPAAAHDDVEVPVIVEEILEILHDGGMRQPGAGATRERHSPLTQRMEKGRSASARITAPAAGPMGRPPRGQGCMSGPVDWSRCRPASPPPSPLCAPPPLLRHLREGGTTQGVRVRGWPRGGRGWRPRWRRPGGRRRAPRGPAPP